MNIFWLYYFWNIFNFCNSVQVLTENDGINVNELESLLLNTQNSTSVRPLSLGASYAGMIYLIPIFNNPRGFCLAEGMF